MIFSIILIIFKIVTTITLLFLNHCVYYTNYTFWYFNITFFLMSIDSFYFYISNDIVWIMIPSIFFAPNISCVDNLYFSGRGGAAAVVWFVLVTVRYIFSCVVFFSFLIFIVFHTIVLYSNYELFFFFPFVSNRFVSFCFLYWRYHALTNC